MLTVNWSEEDNDSAPLALSHRITIMCHCKTDDLSDSPEGEECPRDAVERYNSFLTSGNEYEKSDAIGFFTEHKRYLTTPIAVKMIAIGSQGNFDMSDAVTLSFRDFFECRPLVSKCTFTRRVIQYCLNILGLDTEDPQIKCTVYEILARICCFKRRFSRYIASIPYFLDRTAQVLSRSCQVLRDLETVEDSEDWVNAVELIDCILELFCSMIRILRRDVPFARSVMGLFPPLFHISDDYTMTNILRHLINLIPQLPHDALQLLLTNQFGSIIQQMSRTPNVIFLYVCVCLSSREETQYSMFLLKHQFLLVFSREVPELFFHALAGILRNFAASSLAAINLVVFRPEVVDFIHIALELGTFEVKKNCFYVFLSSVLSGHFKLVFKNFMFCYKLIIDYLDISKIYFARLAVRVLMMTTEVLTRKPSHALLELKAILSSDEMVAAIISLVDSKDEQIPEARSLLALLVPESCERFHQLNGYEVGTQVFE